MRRNFILTRLLGSSLRRKAAIQPLNGDPKEPTTDNSEAALIIKAKGKDEEAFRSLVELHQSKVYHLLLGMLRNEDQAQELTQETFVKAWKGLSSFRGDSTVWTWLYRIAYYTALDYFRKQKREAEILSFEEKGWELMGENDNEPLEVAIRKDKEQALHKAMTRLSFAQRTVLILYYFQGLSYREIAAVTHRPLGTIRADLHRGKEKLREIITKKWGLKDADARPRASGGNQ